jgi:hypothetical protein
MQELVEGDPAVGDEAYVLFNSPVPWLLRADESIINTSTPETSRKNHEIIAWAYIHRIMDRRKHVDD